MFMNSFQSDFIIESELLEMLISFFYANIIQKWNLHSLRKKII